MGKSFWGRLEARKPRPVVEEPPARATAYEERMAKREARTARLLATLEKGTADDAIWQTHRTVAEVREARERRKVVGR